MFNSVTWIMIGVLLQAGSLLIEVFLIRTRKEEWDAIMRNQGSDLDKEITKKQILKLTALTLIVVAIGVQGFGIYLNQFDNLEQLKPIWEEIGKINAKLAVNNP